MCWPSSACFCTVGLRKLVAAAAVILVVPFVLALLAGGGATLIAIKHLVQIGLVLAGLAF